MERTFTIDELYSITREIENSNTLSDFVKNTTFNETSLQELIHKLIGHYANETAKDRNKKLLKLIQTLDLKTIEELKAYVEDENNNKRLINIFKYNNIDLLKADIMDLLKMFSNETYITDLIKILY